MHKRTCMRCPPCREFGNCRAQKQGPGPDDSWRVLPSQLGGHVLASWRACLSGPAWQPGELPCSCSLGADGCVILGGEPCLSDGAGA